MKVCILYIILSLSCLNVFASHIIGGEMTYAFLGTTGTGTGLRNIYKVSLSIYEDCKYGNPEAIAQDNPAIIAVYDGLGNPVQVDSVLFSDSMSVPPNFSNACITNPPSVCVTKKTFVRTYYLSPNTSGYYVAYQRCCRNNQIVNIINPGATGSTYFCKIPPKTIGTNTSAVFKKDPPLIICVNYPFIYADSATDADGDSLSYCFSTSYVGGDNISNPILIAAPPPYGTVTYIYPYTSTYPIASSPQMSIDPITGFITGTPTQQGRYLISICCIEWRHGLAIDTVRREFQFVVTNCSNSVIANIPQLSTEVNTYIISCSSFNVFFENTSVIGIPDSTFHWDFGVPGLVNDTSNQYQPTYTYPDTGTYVVKLVVNPHTQCTDSISRFVKVYPYFAADFNDSGKLCPGYPIYFTDFSTSTIKPIVSWNWSFGDGGTSSIENPVHAFVSGGLYNVSLASSNSRHCVDTLVKQVLVENFIPNSGDDTTIVKGSWVYFNATGGNNYLWRPAFRLNDSTINNPIAFYPDSGTFTYYVYVNNDGGCAGKDSITVHVVDKAAFFMPTAFTPGGHGINSIFRPIAIGYTLLNYLKVFNRWGEEVYFGSSFLEGQGWDGTYKNTPVDMGVYFWEVSYTDRFGKVGYQKGDVTLIR